MSSYFQMTKKTNIQYKQTETSPLNRTQTLYKVEE